MKKTRIMGGKRMNIGVSVNTELWRRLRAIAMLRGEHTGTLLDAAIEKYLSIVGWDANETKKG
jgi:hypothetical protein